MANAQSPIQPLVEHENTNRTMEREVGQFNSRERLLNSPAANRPYSRHWINAEEAYEAIHRGMHSVNQHDGMDSVEENNSAMEQRIN